MILTELEVTERLNSPDNLMNRLKSLTKPSKHVDIPSMPPKIDELINKVDDKLSVAGAKSKALRIMDTAMNRLESVVHEIERPRELASVIGEMNKVVSAQEKNEGNGAQIGQIIIYAPKIASEDMFDVAKVVDVG